MKISNKSEVLPLVKIGIIPTDNSINFENCLKSIIGQTYGNFEAILLENGKTNSKIKKIFNEYSKQDKRIKDLKSDIESTPQYYLIISSDNCLSDNYISESVDFLLNNTEYAGVISKTRIHNQKDELLDKKSFFDIEEEKPIDRVKSLSKYIQSEFSVCVFIKNEIKNDEFHLTDTAASFAYLIKNAFVGKYKYLQNIYTSINESALNKQNKYWHNIALSVVNNIIKDDYLKNSLTSNELLDLNVLVYESILSKDFESSIKQNNLDEDKIKKYFKKINFEKKLQKLAKKYKNKKILIYGAGLFAKVIFENYDMSRFNIVGVVDIKFVDEVSGVKIGHEIEKFKGYKSVNPILIDKEEADAIFISVLHYYPIVDFIKKQNTKLKMELLVKYPRASHEKRNYFKEYKFLFINKYIELLNKPFDLYVDKKYKKLEDNGKTLCFEKSELGDAILRLQYFAKLDPEKVEIMVHKNNYSLFKFYLPDFKLYKIDDYNDFIFKPFYRLNLFKQWFKDKKIFKTLLFTDHCRYEPVLRCAAKIPAKKNIMYQGDRTSVFSTLLANYDEINSKFNQIIKNKYLFDPTLNKLVDKHVSKHLNLIYGQTFNDVFGDDFEESKEFYQEFYSKFKNKQDVEWDKYIVLSIAAGKGTRDYSEENWQIIVNNLPKDIPVVAVGGKPVNITAPNLINLCGKTSLTEAIKIVINADLMVGNETGFTHLAYLSKIPSVCILGGGHFEGFLPWPLFDDIVESVYDYHNCFCCGWQCKSTKCDPNKPAKCIETLSPYKVIQSVNKLNEKYNVF